MQLWKRRFSETVCCSVTVFLLSGCGAVPVMSDSAAFEDSGAAGEDGAEEIELVEPVALPEGWERVEYRDFYDAEVHDAAVYPYTEEYAFSLDVTLDHFNFYPGEKVKKGDALVYGNLEGIDREIEKLEEQLQAMEEEYQEYKADVEESLVDPEGNEKWLKGVLENLEKMEPDNKYEKVPAENPGSDVTSGDAGEPVLTEEYRSWQEEYHYYEGEYRMQEHQNNITRLQLSNRTALYELDHAYQARQLEKLKAQREKYIISSSMSGEVVSISLKESGSQIAKAEAVVAIGDDSRKLVKCEYINSNVINRAEEVYAMINGVRYEVSYQPYSAAEYSSLTFRGETIGSTFGLEEDAAVSVGDYAVIVIVKNSVKKALSVPNDAIHRDGNGKYVYLHGADENVITPVTTGMSDGAYTEVLTGLKEGDRVLVSSPVTAGTERYVLEKGTFSSHYNGNGYFYYPEVCDIENPVTYGTAFFVDYEVKLYQYVEKGDTIATVHVKEDTVTFTRNEVRLKRLQEHFQEWLQENKEPDPKELEEQQEPIRELEELIADMNRDYATTRIVAPQSGIITWLADYKKEDELRTEAVVGQLADANTCYVVVEGRGMLHYGNQVKVYYEDQEGEEKEVEGRVVNLSGEGVSKALQTSYAMIQVPPQVAGEMTESAMQGNFWNRQGLFRVETEAEMMKDVVLVPRDAIKSIQLVPYVRTVGTDGEIVARTFISGGNDREYYWVVDGLSEGEELCLE